MQRALDELPGFRRRFRITPLAGKVISEVEDDYHCMRVTIIHDSHTATAVEPMLIRAPWTTCPGAVHKLKETFTGVALARFAERGEKRANCTHLHDLAVLGAAHAGDAKPLIYDILVSDPVDGKRVAELRMDGATVLRWTLLGVEIVEPAELAGVTLDKLNPWIASLEPHLQEAGRVFRWGTLIANGRSIPLEKQSDAKRMPTGNCYTFQPDKQAVAVRVGEIRDFSKGMAQPLDQRSAVS